MNRRTNPFILRKLENRKINDADGIEKRQEKRIHPGGASLSLKTAGLQGGKGQCCYCCCPLCGYEYEHNMNRMDHQDKHDERVLEVLEASGVVGGIRSKLRGGNKNNRNKKLATLPDLRKIVKRINPSIPVSYYSKKQLMDSLEQAELEGDLLALEFLTKYRLHPKSRYTKAGLLKQGRKRKQGGGRKKKGAGLVGGRKRRGAGAVGGRKRRGAGLVGGRSGGLGNLKALGDYLTYRGVGEDGFYH